MSTHNYADDPDRECAPGKTDPEDFFAERGTEAVRRARQACARCPIHIRTACLQDALDKGEEYGIRGGVLLSSLGERGTAIRGEKTTRDQVHDLWQNRLNDAEIGRTLGIDASTARGHRIRLGLPANRAGRPTKRQQVAA